MSVVRPIVLSLAVLALAACNPPSKDDRNNEDRADTAKEATASGSQADLERAQELVSGASNGQMRASSVFEGPDGLVGIMTEPASGAGGKQIVWSSDNFEVVLPSEAISKNGEPQNAKYLQEENNFISTNELMDKLQDEGFIVGTSGPLLSVFMDPNCIFCHNFYNEAAPLVKSGKLRVRYLMVGFLKPDSTERAATIISSSNPAKALEKDEKAFDKGGAPVSEDITDEDRQKVADLTALMNSAGGGGTPAIVACQKGQEDPTLLSGMPQDFKGFIANLDKDNKACR